MVGLTPEPLLIRAAKVATPSSMPSGQGVTIALLLQLGMATDLAGMCPLSAQFDKLTYLIIFQSLCALLDRGS